MKKIIITLSIVAIGFVSFSQEDGGTGLVNKKGETILPVAGDFALGVDATPFVNLVGNILRINDFTGPFNDPSAFDYLDGMSIYGKYFLSDNAAVRARLNILSTSSTLNNYVYEDGNDDPFARVLDTWKHSESGLGLSLGYELRRGKSRLQAFYGGELGLSFGGGSKDEYTYGNQLDNNDSIPTTTVNWTAFSSAPVDNRTTSLKVAGGFGIGLRGFVGVEYFIFPKISVGGEFGLGFSMNSVGEGEVTTEYWDYATSREETLTQKIAGEKGFFFGDDNMGGNIFLLFHF
jgi:hypothetical protein